MHKPVCLVTGVGPEGGTGAEIAKRFSEDGYQVAMLARNADNLSALAAKYENTRAYPCDVADLDGLTTCPAAKLTLCQLAAALPTVSQA